MSASLHSVFPREPDCRICSSDGQSSESTEDSVVERKEDACAALFMEKQQKSGPTLGANTSFGAALCSNFSSDILDRLHDPIFTTDLEGGITACNAALGQYGYTLDELVGGNLSDLFSGDSHFLANVAIPAVREKNRFQAQIPLRDKSGREFTWHLSLTLLRDADSQAGWHGGYRHRPIGKRGHRDAKRPHFSGGGGSYSPTSGAPSN